MGKERPLLLDASGAVISGEATDESIKAMELASDRMIVDIAARGVTTDKWLYMFRGSDGKINNGLTVPGAKELFEQVYSTPGRVVDCTPLPTLPWPEKPEATMLGVAIRYETPDGKASAMEMIYQPWFMKVGAGFAFDIMAPRKMVGKGVRNCQRDLIPEKELRRFESFCVKHHSKHVQLLGPQDAKDKTDPKAVLQINRIFGIAAQAYDKGKGEVVPREKLIAFVESSLKKQMSALTADEALKAANDLQDFFTKAGREEFRKAVEGETR